MRCRVHKDATPHWNHLSSTIATQADDTRAVLEMSGQNGSEDDDRIDFAPAQLLPITEVGHSSSMQMAFHRGTGLLDEGDGGSGSASRG